VSVCNVHTIMECQRHSAMRSAVNRAGLALRMECRWYG
jgi:hypothetical protein